MKISLSDSAYKDLENIVLYYTELGVPDIGKKFITGIVEHIESLADNPDIGRKVPEFDMPNIRELIHSPFRVIYLRETDKITAVRIWRSERLLNLNGTLVKDKI